MASKRSYHHGNLRAALVTAALREVAKSGPEGFSLREVARRAGVSAPAVYRHFKDKDDLLAAVAGECAERIGMVMKEAVAKAPDDPLEKFRATGIAYVQFAVAHPEHFRAMAIPGLFERAPAEQQNAQLLFQAEERAGLARGQKAGTIAEMPLDHLFLAATSLMRGLAQLIVEGKLGKIDEAQARKLAIEVTAVLGVGLVPRTEHYDDPLSGARFRGRKKG